MQKFKFITATVILSILTLNINAQWTGLNPIITTSDVGVGNIQNSGTLFPLTSPLGQIHISRVEPTSYTPNTLPPKPQIVIQSWCDGIGEPNTPFGSTQAQFSIETNCYDNSLNIFDLNASQQLWRFSSNNTFSSVKNLNIGNNFVLTNSELTLNVPINGFNCIAPATFNSSVDFEAHTYFNEHTYFSKDLQLSNNSAIIFNDATNTTQLKLYGNGNIRAREIKVDVATIPDYVFKTGYKLMPLNELEAFIKANKHLPNIKGENEYNESEGLSLGEMNLKLLEKVEELTLYTIQQQKELEALKKLVSTFVKK